MAAKAKPVGRPKTQYDPKREITFKELLDIKIEHYKNTPKIKNCSEKVLCDQIENLDISVIVHGHNGIKYYGNTSKS